MLRWRNEGDHLPHDLCTLHTQSLQDVVALQRYINTKRLALYNYWLQHAQYNIISVNVVYKLLTEEVYTLLLSGVILSSCVHTTRLISKCIEWIYYYILILPYIAEKDFVVSSSSSPEQTEGEISIQTSINTTTFSGGVCMMARPACMTARYIDLDTIIGLHECYS